MIEDKRTVLAIHYRLAEDAAATRHQILARVIEPARERGLAIATGHFAFEVRPPLSFNKGTAVRRLLDGRRLSGRHGLRRRPHGRHRVRRHPRVGRAGRTRRATVAVAAVTDETPQPVIEAADVLVRATPGVHEVLARFAAAVGAA